MTAPAFPDALDALRKSLTMAANDPGNVIRADGTKVGYKGDRCMGDWIADAILAGPLAPVLAALQRVTAERDFAEASGERAIIAMEHYCNRAEIAETALATATAEAASLGAKVEAKDRALASLADNETLLLRAANLIDCGTAKHCEYFFHSKRVSGRYVPAQCARETEEGRGCLADDATSLRILSGKLREATALARAATAGEGRSDG